MQISKFNTLLRFFSLQHNPDDCGCFSKQYEFSFKLFGDVYLSNINENGKRQYRITISAREANYLNSLKNEILIITYEDHQLLVKNISIDKKLIKIECYDNENTADLIQYNKE